MEPNHYTVQAHVLGLGWLTFAVTRDEARADALADVARTADPKRYPGSIPRKTRILTNGKPPKETPKFEALESWQ